jgi:hypothetical protein
MPRARTPRSKPERKVTVRTLRPESIEETGRTRTPHTAAATDPDLPLYRETIEFGARVHDADGNRWRFKPRWRGDPKPWVLCAEED